MRSLDTNIFLRYLTRDDDVKANACYGLFQRVGRGEEEATTNELIVAELTYVLSSRSHYNLSHDDIRARLTPILNLRGLKLPGKRRCLRALDLYAAYPALDFEDAFSIASLEDDGLAEIYSYDRDFDQVPTVRRVEP
ncbi:MAG TPA: PIN domain-containing protein [Chloroflexota bacterium]|nr:PIN domain-containing protein [Chloroflexota bacterium]